MTTVSQRNGLTIDEYYELLGPPGVDFSCQGQLSTEQAAMLLYLRGYDVRQEFLDSLIELEVLTLAQPAVWTPADIEFAALYFEDCRLFTPYAEMCVTLGCRYVDFLRALSAAAKRETRKYRRYVPAFDQYFVMHRFPPRGLPESAGNLSEIKPAIISFTLADDVRERLERGEGI